jgi:hypothetical protein
VRHGEGHRLPALRLQKPWPRRREGQQGQDAAAKRARKRRHVGPEQKSHHPRAGEAPDAEHGVEARHQGLFGRALDLDRMHVHRHVDRPKRGPKSQQGHSQNDGVVRDGQHGQEQDDADASADNHRPASHSRAEPSRQRHRENGTDPEAQEKQPQLRIVDPGPCLGERYERRPACRGQADRKEGKSCGQPRLRAIR